MTLRASEIPSSLAIAIILGDSRLVRGGDSLQSGIKKPLAPGGALEEFWIVEASGGALVARRQR
jgi:hypothetical protein